MRKKELRISNPLHGDEKYTGPEPVWDTELAYKMAQDDFDHNLGKSLFYYNYYYTPKDLKKYVIKWLQDNTRLTVEQISNYKLSPDYETPIQVGGIIKAHYNGMPLKERHIEYILEVVNRVLHTAHTIEDPDSVITKPTVYIPTIQDRINEKVSTVIGEINGQIDLIFTNRPPNIKIFDYLTTNRVPHASIGKIRAVIQRYVDELALVVAENDEQLVEAYNFLTKNDIKRIQLYLDNVQTDISTYTHVKRATKTARIKKVLNKEKLIAKVKYQKEYTSLKLVSISPVLICGAQELWVFNTKTRKIGCYYAESHGGALSIKGTSIINFDPTKSVAKTIRKPEEKLKEFFKANKVALRTFIKDIKSTETTLNGRLGTDTILLKVQ